MIFTRNAGGWDGTCGGGLWWNTERRYKNANTSELFLTLAALLHQRGHGGGSARLASPAGILTEPCEPPGCDGDQAQFKGIFVRYLYDFHRLGGDPAHRAFILANARSVWQNSRNAREEFGLCWGGPFGKADASRQSSAVDALSAAAGLAAR